MSNFNIGDKVIVDGIESYIKNRFPRNGVSLGKIFHINTLCDINLLKIIFNNLYTNVNYIYELEYPVEAKQINEYNDEFSMVRNPNYIFDTQYDENLKMFLHVPKMVVDVPKTISLGGRTKRTKSKRRRKQTSRK